MTSRRIIIDPSHPAAMASEQRRVGLATILAANVEFSVSCRTWRLQCSEMARYSAAFTLGCFAALVSATQHHLSTDSPIPAPIQFNRDVRPLLSDRCFRCHGPDAGSRKRGLRLDSADGACATLSNGRRAIVPGDLAASEAARRIASDDPDVQMPPPELNRPLTAAQKEILLKWIEQGAEYEPHWAFVPPRMTAPPAVDDTSWSRDPLDQFILTRLEAEKLTPAREASRETLLRRAALALTGLPPTPEETAAFVADTSADAFEKQVDRLLASPRFGERMAVEWLDIARFADTFGYQADWECRTWPWRDWVIAAFNNNLPYDKFVQYQIAGDLLPNPTREQRIATAFNRLHRQTNEGGSIDAEFRQEYVSDRVHTFGTALLGLTIECARCHDHKYDPIPQRDYYSLCVFFGAIDEAGTYPFTNNATPPPAMRLPTPEQERQLADLAQRVSTAEASYRAVLDARRAGIGPWLASGRRVEVAPPVKHFPLDGDIEGPTGKATALDGDSGPSFDDVPAFRRCDPYSLAFWMRCPDTKGRATVIHTSRFTIESDEQGYQVMLKDGRLCWEVIHYWPGSAAAIRTTQPFPLNTWTHVAVTYDGSSRADGLRVFLNGEPAQIETVRDQLDGVASARAFQIGFRDRDQGLRGGAVDDVQVFDRALTALEVAESHQPGALRDALARGAAQTPDPAITDFYLGCIDDECRAARRTLHDARAAYQDLLESIPELMVMEKTRWPRDSFVLTRGAYDQPDLSHPVRADRAIEAVLPYGPTEPHDRLGLANWLTDPRNPLCARVEVNRLWALCFGRGIVSTLENFGQQGEPPTHPELLDTLAADFVADGWNIKVMLRRLVLSSAFRQASELTDEKLAKDPENALLSRGPAFRLSAETLRDQALAAAGLLVEKIGGPSVKPWQPPGLWEDAGANSQGNAGYVPDTGDNAHRRSLYTFRKRTAPPPNMLAFDAGSREQCLARRQPTNTPLQPLVLMNDPVFFECARGVALRVAKECGDDPQARITRAFRLLAAREPRPAEIDVLRKLYDEQNSVFAGDNAASRAVLQADSADAPLAALTLVCSTLLASDAVVMSR